MCYNRLKMGLELQKYRVCKAPPVYIDIFIYSDWQCQEIEEMHEICCSLVRWSGRL